MNFFEQKKLAKALGMDIHKKTTMLDIEAFLEDNKEQIAEVIKDNAVEEVTQPEYIEGENYPVAIIEEPIVEKLDNGQVELVDEPEVKEVVKIVEVYAPCKHNYEFASIQALRGPNVKDEDGRTAKGELSYKDKFICTLCNEVEFRDPESK